MLLKLKVNKGGYDIVTALPAPNSRDQIRA